MPRQVGRPYRYSLYNVARSRLGKAALLQMGKYAYRKYDQSRKRRKTNGHEVDEGSRGSIKGSVQDARSGRYIRSRRKRRNRRPKPTLKKRIVKLEKNAKLDKSVKRQIQATQHNIFNLTNQCAYRCRPVMSKGNVDALLDQMITTPEAGGEPVPFTSTVENVPFVATGKLTYKIKNNYPEPVALTIYEHVAVEGTNETPLDVGEIAIKDYSLDPAKFMATDVNLDFNSVYIGKTIKKKWKQIGIQKMLLRAGDTAEVQFFSLVKMNEVDWKVIDSAYFKGSKMVSLRTQGEVCHKVDQPFAVGFDKARLDIVAVKEWSIQGHANGSPKQLESTQNLALFPDELVDPIQFGPNVGIN